MVSYKTMNINGRGRHGVSSSQILNEEFELIKMVGGKAVVVRSHKVGNRVVKKTEDPIRLQTEEQQEVSKMPSSGIEESQRSNFFENHIIILKLIISTKNIRNLIG